MAHDIYICHASDDRSIAADLAVALEKAGLSCWIAPRDVPAGADYAQAIVAGISNAEALVLVYSEHSNESPHVGREIERAVSGGTDIISFRLSDVQPPPSLEYFISSARRVDATTGNALDHVAELAAAIQKGDSGEPAAELDQSAAETLRRIVDEYGREVADDPRRVQALLRDMAGDSRAEVAALVAASEEGVGATLLQAPQGLTPEAAQRLARRLRDNRSLTEEASKRAVATWLYALGMEAPAPAGTVAPAAAQVGETVAPSPGTQSVAASSGEGTLEPTVAATDRYAGAETQPQPVARQVPAAPQPTIPEIPSAAPARPARSSPSWLVPASVAVLGVAAVVAGVILFSGSDDGGTVATRGTTVTTIPQQTTAPEADFFSLAGLTVTDVVSRYPAEAESRGLPVGCSALVDLTRVDVETDRLRAGEEFVWGSFQAPFCDTELWGILDAGGTLRELTVQVSEPTGESVRQMMDMALALVGTVAFPEATEQFVTDSLDEFGWLSASDPTTHQGNAVIGSVQLGTFLHEGGFTFYMVPAS